MLLQHQACSLCFPPCLESGCWASEVMQCDPAWALSQCNSSSRQFVAGSSSSSSTTHPARLACCRAKFAEFLSKQPWGDKSNQYFYTREEEYVHGLRCALGIWWVAICLDGLPACLPRPHGNKPDTASVRCWTRMVPTCCSRQHVAATHMLCVRLLCAPC